MTRPPKIARPQPDDDDDDDDQPLSPSIDPPPPSYDLALALDTSATAEGSSSSETRTIPTHLKYLFAGPSNAEPLLSAGGSDAAAWAWVEGVEIRKNGSWLESCDARLEDPDTLYEFLRAMAMSPPKITVQCIGAHNETCERQAFIMNPEDRANMTENRGETTRVVDFDFTIDLSHTIDRPTNNSHIHLSSVMPWEPARRGTSHSTYAATYAPKRRAPSPRVDDRQPLLPTAYPGTEIGARGSWQDIMEWAAWEKYRIGKGLPRWARMEDTPGFKRRMAKKKDKGKGIAIRGLVGRDTDIETGIAEEAVRTTPSLRDWCVAYCADKGPLKEFVMRKELCGWDIDGLQAAITSAIVSQGYPLSNLQVNVELDATHVVVRPDNRLNRALSNPWLYFLSWITLVYPIILLWKWLSSRGGGTWAVAFVSYALKFYPPLPSTFPKETAEAARRRVPSLGKLHPEMPRNPQIQYGPKGVHYLVGKREGDWFKDWEKVIKEAVMNRYQGELMCEAMVPELSRSEVSLDGY
ncbi:hypothetical protein IAT38_003765 [Cryptococcus sp. DSM 104549]